MLLLGFFFNAVVLVVLASLRASERQEPALAANMLFSFGTYTKHEGFPERMHAFVSAVNDGFVRSQYRVVCCLPLKCGADSEYSSTR